jgi:hypothetical protein
MITLSTDQLERLTALLALGTSVAMQGGSVGTNEAEEIIFSLHTLHQLKKHGVRKSVSDLVHCGMELGAIARNLPEALDRTHLQLQKDALACLAEFGEYDVELPTWLESLDIGGTVVTPASESQLIENISGSNLSLAVSSAFALGERGVTAAIPSLRQVLTTTTRAELRDACALALADLNDAGCIEIVAKLLCDPVTIGQRASLVYALDPFDNRPQFVLLVELVIGETDEARNRALDLIAVMEPGVGLDELQCAEDSVRKYLLTKPDGRHCVLLLELLGFIEELKTDIPS